jgi:peptidoglycan hydrolase CwlO-like protein
LNPKSRSRGLAKSKNKFIYAIPILVLLFSIGLYCLFGESLQSFFEDESQTEVIEENPEEIEEELSFLRARVHKLAANL